MNELIDSFTVLKQQCSKKVKRMAHIDSVIRLLEKLTALEDTSLETEFQQLLMLLENGIDDRIKRKEYIKIWRHIKTQVKVEYQFVEKGDVVGQYMSLGIAFGLLLGVAFSWMHTVYMVIGFPIGLALGLTLGQKKEYELEHEGKVY